MVEKRKRFEIWSEQFSTTDSRTGIYKIYFEGYPQHSYIGMVWAKGGFEKKIKEHQKALWNLYTGGNFNWENWEAPEMSQSQYQKLDVEQRKEINEHFAWKRSFKIQRYENDDYQTGETKYLKMLVFMQMHQLILHDLRFEILSLTEQGNSWDLPQLKAQLIEQNQCYEKGFNAILATTYDELGFKKLVDLELLKRIRTFALNDVDEYTKWNCWRSLHQVFVDAFLLNPLGWMNYWNKISLEDLKTGFEQLTRLLYAQNLTSEMFDANKVSDEEIRQLLNYDHQNVDFLFANRKSTTIEERININQWIENDQVHYFGLVKIIASHQQELYDFFGSWEEINFWFEKHSLVKFRQPKNSSLIEHLMKNFWDSIECLKNSHQALKKYQEIKAKNKNDDEWNEDEFDKNDYQLDTDQNQNLGEDYLGNLIYDYYFVKNYLNALIFLG